MRGRTLFPLAMATVLLGACSDDPATPAQAATAQAGGGDDDASTDVATITAQGTGQASAAPDTMVAFVAMHTEAATAAQTLDENSLRTIQLQQTAREQGLADEDIQTTNVTVFPRFDPTGRRVVGYSADNSFTLRFRDLETAGTQLDAIMNVGGDFLQIHGLSLEIDDPTEVLAEARADAVRRASEQARQLAEASGVELGAIRTISEVTFGGVFPASGFGEGAAAARDDSLQVPVPISPGAQDVSLSVTVVYEIAQ